jgi:cytochrome c-type biogenesis protein
LSVGLNNDAIFIVYFICSLMTDISFIAAVGAGFLSFLSPCVLPLVPPYLAYIAGNSLDELAAREDASVNRRALLAAILFVAGFSTVFILLGASASVLGGALRAHIQVLGYIAAALIITMGLHFLGVLRIGLFMREARVEVQKPAGLLGAYIMGLAFAFGWTPCIGPVLATILTFAGREASVSYGAWLLAAYSIGLGVPFLLAALAMGQFIGIMKRFRRYIGIVEKVTGALLVLTGLAFLTGSVGDVSIWLLEVFPGLQKLG